MARLHAFFHSTTTASIYTQNISSIHDAFASCVCDRRNKFLFSWRCCFPSMITRVAYPSHPTLSVPVRNRSYIELINQLKESYKYAWSFTHVMTGSRLLWTFYFWILLLSNYHSSCLSICWRKWCKNYKTWSIYLLKNVHSVANVHNFHKGKTINYDIKVE